MLDGTTWVEAHAADAEAEFRDAVAEVFGSSCKAAWLSGSFVYEGATPGRSDIDVVVVLERSVPAPADDETLERIRAFVDAYLAVHARRGLDPDLYFPGEYVTPAAISEAIAWRGLAMDGDVASEFPVPESTEYWIGRPDRWFHAWLSMTAFTRFLTGDVDYHRRAKLEAWKSIIRFLLFRRGEPMTLDGLWPGLAQFGVKPKYQAFWQIEKEHAQRALDELETEGVIERANGEFAPIMAGLREWERQLGVAIAADDGDPPLLLPPELHREIGAHAARRWPAVARESGI